MGSQDVVATPEAQPLESKSKSSSDLPHHRVTGFSLFLQQCKALLIKNFILAYRNSVATFLQLFASFFFVFLIFAVDRAVQASLSSRTEFQNVYNPVPTQIPGIRPCENAYYIKPPCYDFLYSGNESAVIRSIAYNMSVNNPGQPIDFDTQVLGFATPADVDTWLLANPYKTTGAVHFSFTPNGALGYGLQTNSTVKNQRGIFEDGTFDYQTPLQAAAEREIARHLAQDWSIEWTPSYAEFAHPAVSSFSAVAQAGPTFLFAASMFSFVTQASNLVTERQLKLRQAMNTMGLMDSVFWTTWTLWEMGLAIITVLLLIAFGCLFMFDFFLHNAFAVLFFMFFLFWFAMTTLAFWISTFLKKADTANSVGFFIFIFGFVVQLVVIFGFPYDKDFPNGARIIFSLFPPALLALGLKYLGDATSTNQDPGVSWSDINSCTYRNADCTYTMADIYLWLFVMSWVYLVLALYFDNVLPDANGQRKSLFYFVYPSFWTGKSARTRDGGGLFSFLTRTPPPPPNESADDEDVIEEAEKVKRAAESDRGQEGEEELVAVSVRGLVKTYPSRLEMKGCSCKSLPPFHAIKGSWFTVEKDKLFCLLGPNGAGKSTTINCLTGIIGTTAGDGLVYGKSIRNPSSMATIRSQMGVCPQFDILWDRLTGSEHLFLFARIKGLKRMEIPKEVETLLEEVRLTDSQLLRSSGYSGGMKRRLSVAVALIGDPKVVYLDEPTTGMDPVSRRHVWDIIERAKRGRAIILTTHSMEEADILGDRIAIMAKGRLRCIGTSIHLKNRFGAGFIVTVGIASGNQSAATLRGEAAQKAIAERTEGVKKFFAEKLGVSPTDETAGYIKFLVAREKEPQLTGFFKELKDAKSELGIVDIQLSLSTLEEVFLNIARAAELETAQVEGRFEAIVLPDGTNVEVPIGAEHVLLPADGTNDARVLDIVWQQDDTGTLRIANFSDPRPADPSLLASHSSLSSGGHRSSRRDSVVAEVITNGQSHA